MRHQIVEIRGRRETIILGRSSSFARFHPKWVSVSRAKLALRAASADPSALHRLAAYWVKEYPGAAKFRSEREVLGNVEAALDKRSVLATVVPTVTTGGVDLAKIQNVRLEPAAQTVRQTPLSVADMSIQKKIEAVLERTGGELKGEARAAVDFFKDEKNREDFIKSLVLIAALQMIPGIGEALDLIMLGALYAAGGFAALHGGYELGNALRLTLTASSEDDLNNAAKSLASFVKDVGVVVLMLVVHKLATKTPTASAEGDAVEREESAAAAGRRTVGSGKSSSGEPSQLRETPDPDPQQANGLTASPRAFLKAPLPKGELEKGALPGEVSPTINAMPDIPESFRPIPQDDVNKFSSTPEAKVLTPGTKLYRIIGDGNNPAGSFWTRTMPQSEAEWRSTLAVKGEWNGNGGYVEYTVPEGGLPAWTGTAASQPAAVPGYVLNGGGDQVFIPLGSGVPVLKPTPTAWSGM